jgi:hypothetical protein
MKAQTKKSIGLAYDQGYVFGLKTPFLFSAIINPIPTRKESVHFYPITILHQAHLLNPKFINDSHGYKVITV